MNPKRRQLEPGAQTVTDINKVRMKKILNKVQERTPNAIFAYEEDQIAKGNVEHDPKNPYPFTDLA